jgi:hypothetical protein
MIVNHLLTGLTFGLSLSFISWMVGIVGNALLLKAGYIERLSNLNFLPSQAQNDLLGIGVFRRIVKGSVFRFLNQGIRVDGTHADLAALRHQMTLAETSHLLGFCFVAIAAVYQGFHVSLAFGLSMMIPNVVLNGYPSLLQQENKRRIDRLLERQGRGSRTMAPRAAS